ncbi:hypothetical protein D3C71_1971800 [compost metagenome]
MFGQFAMQFIQRGIEVFCTIQLGLEACCLPFDTDNIGTAGTICRFEKDCFIIIQHPIQIIFRKKQRSRDIVT